MFIYVLCLYVFFFSFFVGIFLVSKAYAFLSLIRRLIYTFTPIFIWLENVHTDTDTRQTDCKKVEIHMNIQSGRLARMDRLQFPIDIVLILIQTDKWSTLSSVSCVSIWFIFSCFIMVAIFWSKISRHSSETRRAIPTVLPHHTESNKKWKQTHFAWKHTHTFSTE